MLRVMHAYYVCFDGYLNEAEIRRYREVGENKFPEFNYL